MIIHIKKGIMTKKKIKRDRKEGSEEGEID